MNCTEASCKHQATNKAKTLWGKEDTIGFCDNHTPDWLKDLKTGQLSKPKPLFGVTKSWYQKV